MLCCRADRFLCRKKTDQRQELLCEDPGLQEQYESRNSHWRKAFGLTPDQPVFIMMDRKILINGVKPVVKSKVNKDDG